MALVFGESPTSRLGNSLVGRQPTSNTRSASSTTPTLHCKRQAETSPTPAPKRLREQSTYPLASPVENHRKHPPASAAIDDLEPPVDTSDDLSQSHEQPSAIGTVEDVEYPADGAKDDIPLPLEVPLTSAASDSIFQPGEHPPPANPDLSEHHPNIKTYFHQPSARVLTGPTITNRLRELSADPPATPGDQNRLRGQHIGIGPVETTLLCEPGRPMLETIKAFTDLTPQTLELILKDYRGRVAFPNLKVDPEEFRCLERTFPGEEDPSFEYDADDKKITLLAPATPLHQKVKLAVQGWLEEVADEISNGQEEYGCVTQYEVQLTTGSTKVPDVVLLPQKAGSYPLVAVEVGFTEPLDKLYEDAERLIQGSNRAIESVILIHLTESNEHRGHDHPWGQDPQILRSKTHNELSSIIDVWFTNQGLKLIGDVDGKVFFYPKQRQTRPRIPLHTFKYNPGKHQISSGGQGAAPKVTIKSQKFNFPVRKLEAAVKQGILFEKNRRIIRMIKKAGLLS